MNNIIPSIKYAWLTAKHKFYVYKAGKWTGAPWWRLIVHDLSKFGPKELPHYGRHFFGDKSDPEGFARAWQHHWTHNHHHWEYWVIVTQHTKNKNHISDEIALDMPEAYIREMVADWLGAGRAYEGSWPDSDQNWTWLNNNLHKMKLSKNTLLTLEKVLKETFERKNNAR